MPPAPHQPLPLPALCSSFLSRVVESRQPRGMWKLAQWVNGDGQASLKEIVLAPASRLVCARESLGQRGRAHDVVIDLSHLLQGAVIARLQPIAECWDARHVYVHMKRHCIVYPTCVHGCLSVQTNSVAVNQSGEQIIVHSIQRQPL